METPKVYLISRNMTEEQVAQVREALVLTPLSAIVITDVRDTDAAIRFCDTTARLQAPIAIFADFSEPLTAINPDGSLCQIPL